MANATKASTLGLGRYTMRVESITPNRRQFNGMEGTRFVHDIYFMDMNTNMLYFGEHVTALPYQEEYRVGEMCCFRISDVSKNEISKCAPVITEKPAVDEDDFSPSTTNVSGKSYCFAAGYATQMMTARIRAGQISGEEADLMTQWQDMAWKMHQWMMDPKPVTEPTPKQAAAMEYLRAEAGYAKPPKEDLPF